MTDERSNHWLEPPEVALPQWHAEFRDAMARDMRAMAAGKRGCSLEVHWNQVVDLAQGGVRRNSQIATPTYQWILGAHSLLQFLDRCRKVQA